VWKDKTPREIANDLADVLESTLGSEFVLVRITGPFADELVESHVRAQMSGHDIDVIGLPDARRLRPDGLALLARLSAGRPAIVLAHDPFWFAHVPAGPYLTLAGHTHGGQVVLPFVGALRNASRAPLRWSYGLIEEGGRRMYVTSGLGTSGIPLRIGMPPEYVILDIAGALNP